MSCGSGSPRACAASQEWFPCEGGDVSGSAHPMPCILQCQPLASLQAACTCCVWGCLLAALAALVGAQDTSCSAKLSPVVPEVALTSVSLLRMVGLVLKAASEHCISTTWAMNCLQEVIQNFACKIHSKLIVKALSKLHQCAATWTSFSALPFV